MEEKNGLATALNALGDKIIELENSVKYERYLKEENERTLTARINQLQAELNEKNDALAEAHALIEKMDHKLEAVNAYFERLGG